MRNKISVCMMVKNEEKTLQRALDSIHGADELIIVDTGSTDGTLDIIWKYIREGAVPATMSEKEWGDNFSEMRNYTMDLATHERILILDADEWILDGGWEKIHEAIQDPHFIVGTLQVFNESKQGSVKGETVIQPRVFKNHTSLRYKNAVHNQIDDAIKEYAGYYFENTGEKGSLIGIDAHIIHTGYSLTVEETVAKYTPRLAGIRKEISRFREAKDWRHVAYYEYQLASMLHMVFNAEDALPIWNTLDYEHLNPFNRWHAHYTAARAFLAIDDHKSAAKHCNGMLEAMAHPNTSREPVSLVITGVVMCDRARKVKDLDLLKEGLALMIQGFFENLQPEYGTRCIMDSEKVKEDIVYYLKFIDEFTSEYLLSESNKQLVFKAMRETQRRLFPFNESLLEGVA